MDEWEKSERENKNIRYMIGGDFIALLPNETCCLYYLCM